MMLGITHRGYSAKPDGHGPPCVELCLILLSLHQKDGYLPCRPGLMDPQTESPRIFPPSQ